MNPFIAMQHAVDIVSKSPHPKNKIAASFFIRDYSIARTNYWPEIIEKKLDHSTRIGNSSGTIHAETAALIAAWEDGIETDEGSICITDPFCPNCAKNMAEAGIRTIYVDHKGFKKDFFARRVDHFETMSMQICEKAGISVYELWRKDEKLVPIFMAPKAFSAANDSPITVDDIDHADEHNFKQIVAGATALHARRKFTLCFAEKPDGGFSCLIARGHPVIGLSMCDPNDIRIIEHPQDKYSFMQEPVNRMIMYMIRYGYKPIKGYFYCSQVPTSREQVNMIGAGITRIIIGDLQKSRDKFGLIAKEQLEQAALIRYD